MRKRLGTFAILLTLSVSACASQNSEAETAVESSTTESSSAEEETASQADISEEIPETINSLEEYLKNYPDSLTHHLLYDVALNEDSTSIDDEGVTYMFSKDDEGNRIPGGVIAYYKSVEGLDQSGMEPYCISFVDNMLPELSSLMNSAKVQSDENFFAMSLIFDDYSIALMPDKDLDGLSVILSESE